MSAFDLTPRLAREAKSNGKDTTLFDKVLPGFRLRIHPSGRKVWIVQARIRAGGNSADDFEREKKTPTLREFADEYLRRCEPHWKPSGRELDANEALWPEAVAAIRLLALTGCRRSEVLNLRWRDIGEDAINLEDSKTDPRAVPLGEAARALIETLPGPGKPEAFLFPSFAHRKGYYRLHSCWRAVCEDAKLGRLRLHDLRHTAASQAVMSGEGLPLVGRLLGHSRHRTTAGYAHLDDVHLVEAAEKIGSTIADAMEFEFRLR